MMKVVHASTLAAQTQNKAFHHENRPTIEESARLPIRARSEVRHTIHLNVFSADVF